MSSMTHRRWLLPVLLTVLTLIAAVPRFWNAGRLGLCHFDEGIYAFAGLWIRSTSGISAIDPNVIAYAPPGFPILVGIAHLMLGINDVSGIVVSQVMGVLTIPLVYWVSRRSFGVGAGLASSSLAALAGHHVAFSRMGLTDISF